MDRRGRLVLLVLCTANFLVGIDFSILTIAVPAIGRDLHLGESDLQWVATAFALPSGGLLLLFGRTGDLIGRRRVFLGGMVLFTLASLLTALAWSPAVLLTARALQGLGAAGVVPTGMALLTTSFAEGRARDRALGIAGSLMATGFTVGTLIGGVVTDLVGWRFTMVLPIVLGVLVVAGTPLLVEESRNSRRERLDLPGAVTVTGGLLALIYALSTAAQGGWGRPSVLGTLAAGVVLLALFLAVQARSAQPLVSLRVLRRRTVALGNLGGLLAFATATSVSFVGELFLQQVNGLSPIQTGLVFGWLGVVAAVSGNLAPRAIGRFGSGNVLVVGLFVQGLGTVVIATMTRGDSVVILLLGGTVWIYANLQAIVGYNVTATSGLPDVEQGLATGLATTTQQVGLTVGIPVMSALAAGRTNGLVRSGRGQLDALAGGFHLAMGVNAAITLGGALLLGVALRRRVRER
ncbi:MFS transporter [Actinospica durhamensis]|uniref:MFS transporter n=1 Tax=Actinospica durhamensis TaxID=1508375 RepID=A0A941IRG6_9ACTN|nr:MFS transporter [Actinospica durhamensis]MBR7832271.1 MFS transporter [Actinospica durhamensis]